MKQDSKQRASIDSDQLPQDQNILADLPSEETHPQAEKSVDIQEEKAFEEFFEEVLGKLPERPAKAIRGAYKHSRHQAEDLVDRLLGRYQDLFEDFLQGVDDEKRRQTYQIIHRAALTAAVIGLSPVPFSDAFLLVTVQLAMMSRLHKIFGVSFAKNLASSISRELVVVGLGRSAAGNIMKLFPGVGTAAGAAVNASVAVAITVALGWVTVKMLNEGEDIFDDLVSFEGQFKKLFKSLVRLNKDK